MKVLEREREREGAKHTAHGKSSTPVKQVVYSGARRGGLDPEKAGKKRYMEGRS